MKSADRPFENVTVRRAVVADMDKVRYLVFKDEKDYVAVIAENALMAVKVSGIKKPFKIVRDLPTAGISVAAQKMAAKDDSLARIKLPLAKKDAPKQLVADLSHLDAMPEKDALFKPMNIGELQRNKTGRMRILPPDLLHEIIEEHAKSMMHPVADEKPATVAPTAPAPASAPVPVPPAATPESVMAMANSMNLPSAATAPVEDKELSPEEVDKLLNG